MKRTINLIFLLCLLAVPVCQAQKITTEEEYKVFYDSIASRLKIAEKDSSRYIGKPVSELVKHLDQCGVKIMQVGASRYDNKKLYPQHLYGIMVSFTTIEQEDFARSHYLREPVLYIHFKESLPYEKYLSLLRKYQGYFEPEVEAFYSGAIIESMVFVHPDDMYMKIYRRE